MLILIYDCIFDNVINKKYTANVYLLLLLQTVLDILWLVSFKQLAIILLNFLLRENKKCNKIVAFVYILDIYIDRTFSSLALK